MKRDVEGKPLPVEEEAPKPDETPVEEEPEPVVEEEPEPDVEEEDTKEEPKEEPEEKKEEGEATPADEDEAIPSDEEKDEEKKPEESVPSPEECNSGIWLFTDRENPTHFFKPNFLPPYNTPEKRKIILDVLKEEWDEKTLSWKPCGEGSMTKKPESRKLGFPSFLPLPSSSKKDGDETSQEINPFVEKLDELFGEFLSHMRQVCAPLSKDTTSSTTVESTTVETKAAQ